MLRLFRLCLPALVLGCAAHAAFAQTTVFGAPGLVTPNLLASDGNIYGIYNGELYAIATTPNGSSYTALTGAVLTGGYLCLEMPNSSFLGLMGSTVFEVTMQGTVKTVGTLPTTQAACPTMANDGNYYGGNYYGGAYDAGYLYQVTSAGALNIIYNFTGKGDGSGPGNFLLQGSDGNLYGTGGLSGTPSFFRFSATTGLTVLGNFVSNEIAAYHFFEEADGNFSSIAQNTLLTVTQQGVIASSALNVPEDATGGTANQYNAFMGGNGDLYVEEEYTYYGVYIDTCLGTFYSIYEVNPSSRALGLVGAIGTDEADSYVQDDEYQLSETLAGNGSLYGAASDLTSQVDTDNGVCDVGTYSNFGYTLSVGNPSMPMNLSAYRILPGKSTTLTWAVNNAFSDTLQQCYGYGGLSGKVALSGSKTLTYPAAGTYTTAIVCGGTETGLAQVVVGDTQLQLSSSASSVFVGQPVTLRAAVSNPGTPEPTGTVQFLHGTQVLATSTLGTGGEATYTASTTGLPVGHYAVTAKYSGDGNYSVATSSPLTITLQGPVATTTTLATSTPTLPGGQAAMFTVSVANGGAASPATGTVALYLGSQELLSSALSPGRPSTASLSASTAGVPPGKYSITAKYSGDSSNAPSVSAPLTVTVQPGDTITVSATPNPVPANDSFQISASVKGNSGTPTGTVVFYAGSQELAGTALSGSGVATATIPAGTLAAGTYSITAAYAGDSKNPSGTSAAYSLTVQ